RRVGLVKLLCGANDLGQLIDGGVLLINRKLRVADDVHEENMRDLQLDFFLDLSRHTMSAPWNRAREAQESRARRDKPSVVSTHGRTSSSLPRCLSSIGYLRHFVETGIPRLFFSPM